MTEIKSATINRNVLKAVNLASRKENTRYYLNGVLLEIAERHVTYVATNGHILLVHRETMESNPNTLTGNFIVPSEICAGWKKCKFEFDALQEDENGKLRFIMTGQIFAPVDGTFPAWRRVLPRPQVKPCQDRLAWFDPKLLVTLARAAELIIGQGKRVPYVDYAGVPYVDYAGDNAAWVLWGELPHTFGVIMPCRVHVRQPPAWLGLGEAGDMAEAA